LRANSGAYLYKKRLALGENFCCAGGVWSGEFDAVERGLTEPQARGYRLASSLLDPNHLPMAPENGRNVFLLSLSDKAAGGNGDHEAFRGALVDVLFNDEARERQNSPVAKELLAKLVEDYKEMGHTAEFFSDNNDRGFKDFLLRYLHYVIFELDPNDMEIVMALNKLHYDSSSAGYFLAVAGNLFQFLRFRDWPQQFMDVAKIYANSPAMANFTSNDPNYNMITKHDLSMAALAMMSLAGMVGPLTHGLIATGFREFNNYEGQETHKIDVTKVWDQLDLENRDEVKRYLFECGRLRTPVSNSHRLATEDFTIKIRGKNRTFPKGTTIFIPIMFAMVDEGFWGKTTFQFDHNREKLCPYSMIFHSVGDRSAGRICPGRGIAVEMLVDVLIELGKVRDAGGINKSSPDKASSLHQAKVQ